MDWRRDWVSVGCVGWCYVLKKLGGERIFIINRRLDINKVLNMSNSIA